MLDSLNSLDGSTWSVGQAWLNQVLQRHDIARVLEPLLLLLLHPKTQRVSVQRVQAECYWTKSPYHPEEENEKHFMQKFSCADGMYTFNFFICYLHATLKNVVEIFEGNSQNKVLE